MLEHFKKGMSDERAEAERRDAAERKEKEDRQRLTDATIAVIREAHTNLFGEYQGGRLPRNCDVSFSSGELIVRNNRKQTGVLAVGANGDEVELRDAGDSLITKAKVSDDEAMAEFWQCFGRETVKLFN